MALIDFGLPFLATLFAYLSWKRTSMDNIYELEDALRSRLAESANTTNFYSYQLARVQIAEYGGLGYSIRKYLPYIGGVRGESIVYLYFFSPDGEETATLPTIEEIRNHSGFGSMPISSISWKGELAHMPEGDRNLEIVFDTVDPDDMLKSITDLSGVMIEQNRARSVSEEEKSK